MSKTTMRFSAQGMARAAGSAADAKLRDDMNFRPTTMTRWATFTAEEMRSARDDILVQIDRLRSWTPAWKWKKPLQRLQVLLVKANARLASLGDGPASTPVLAMPLPKKPPTRRIPEGDDQ